MKTYSVALKKHGEWFTNWHKYTSLDDIDWSEVYHFCQDGNYSAYGYYYGHNSNCLTSDKCRTILHIF